MMSFSRSIGCGVTAFETDVQLRYRGKASTPFVNGLGRQRSHCSINVNGVILKIKFKMFLIIGAGFGSSSNCSAS